jgi:hypothetical protein
MHIQGAKLHLSRLIAPQADGRAAMQSFSLDRLATELTPCAGSGSYPRYHSLSIGNIGSVHASHRRCQAWPPGFSTVRRLRQAPSATPER